MPAEDPERRSLQPQLQLQNQHSPTTGPNQAPTTAACRIPDPRYDSCANLIIFLGTNSGIHGCFLSTIKYSALPSSQREGIVTVTHLNPSTFFVFKFVGSKPPPNEFVIVLVIISINSAHCTTQLFVVLQGALDGTEVGISGVEPLLLIRMS
jgi:hypothetical protein